MGIQGIHCAHVIVDGLIDTPRIRKMRPDTPEDNKISPDAIAEVYWQLHEQHRSAWAQEIDIRPFTEKW